MKHPEFSRRDFVKTSLAGLAAISAGIYPFTNDPIVSVVKIKNGKIGDPVKKALD